MEKIMAWIMVSPQVIEEKLTTKFKQTQKFLPRLERKLREYCERQNMELVDMQKNVGVLKQEFGYKVSLKATAKPIKTKKYETDVL